MDIHEKDGFIYITKPLCPMCLDTMHEHGLSYNKGVTQQYEDTAFSVITILGFICNQHPQMKILCTQQELDRLNQYPRDKIVYHELPMDSKTKEKFKKNIQQILNNALNKK